MLSRSQEQGRSVKETIHNVHVVFHAIVHHLGTVGSLHYEDGQLAVNRLDRHLDVGLRTIVHNMHGPRRYIAAFDFIIPIHVLERRVWQLSDTLSLSLFPLFRLALSCQTRRSRTCIGIMKSKAAMYR